MTTILNKNIVISLILLVLAAIIFEMSSDLYLPSLPEMSLFYAVENHIIVMTISGYMMGFSIMGLVGGALSDVKGRRPVFMLGLGVFLLGSLGCYFAPSIYMVIASRFAQGMGAGISYVVSTAMIKDRFPDHMCSRIFSLMGTALALSPTIAPLIGAKISILWGWQTNFTIILWAALAIYFLCHWSLFETLPPAEKQTLNFKKTMASYIDLFKDLHICGYALISGMTYGSLWAWIALAPFFFIQSLGVSTEDYAYYVMIGPIAYMLSAFINQALVTKLGIDRMLKLGLVIITIGSVYLTIITFHALFNKIGLISGFVLFSLGLAPVFSNASTRSLDVPANQRGTASAVLGLIEMVAAAVYAYLATWFNDGTIRPAALMMIVSSILCILLYMLIQQRNKIYSS